MKAELTQEGITRVSVAWAATGLIEIAIGVLIGSFTSCQCASNEITYVLLGLLSIVIAIVLNFDKKAIARQLERWSEQHPTPLHNV